MRHPFDGINAIQPVTSASSDTSANRRSWIKGLLSAFAGLFVWNRAEAQGKIEIQIAKPAVPVQGIAPAVPGVAVPIRIRPDGSVEAVNSNDPEPMDLRSSSVVRGEEGASISSNRLSTEALREEGALTRALNEDMTRALNEGAVTQALRENGRIILPAPAPAPIPGQVTTLALGEEGGKN